jgi:hypothetical protein
MISSTSGSLACTISANSLIFASLGNFTSASLIVWGDKITGDISGLLRFHASKELSQTPPEDWEHLDLVLESKADNCKIWRF